MHDQVYQTHYIPLNYHIPACVYASHHKIICNFQIYICSLQFSAPDARNMEGYKQSGRPKEFLDAKASLDLGYESD